MPKPGFKSYLLKDETYDFWKKEFEQNKDNLRQKGITSFTGFLTHMMNKSIKQNTHVDYFMKKVYLKENLLAIQDNIQNRVVELVIKNGKIKCIFDEKDNCVHVGFAYSIPEVIKLLNKQSNH